MFAIIDLETTGGNPSSERIIEIGIVLHDGRHKIGEYTTLINPEKEISAFISTFTGITNSMVKNAPAFSEVADTILELTEGKIIVAHNARFDYNFIKAEFRRLNIPFVKKNICTVLLSRKIFPEIRSHSLGNLCRDLGIEIDNRHRAFGDAAATALLLEKLIAHDTKSILREFLEDDINKIHLPKHLDPKVIDTLPEEVGVFYLHDASGNVVYLDKTKNIREYIFTFFSKRPTEKYKQLLHAETHAISYELTGNELIASLLEASEIRKLKPRYNRPVSNSFYRYGLFSETDQQGFRKLLVRLLDDVQQEEAATSYSQFEMSLKNPLLKFSSKFKAEKMMHSILNNFRLEPAFKKIDDALQYNKRMEEILSRFVYPHNNFFIIDAGRAGTEKSAIQIENGEFKGYGYFEPEYIRDPEELKETIRYKWNISENKKLIQTYIRKNSKYVELVAY
jgi:DNA polymerase-3 subunit epsilon